MPTLTEYQAKLLFDLSKEFDKLNPKAKVEGVQRFSVGTITDCINEETKFRETILKYNTAMGLILKKEFDAQLKAISAEYKSVLTIVCGARQYNDDEHGSYAKLLEASKRDNTYSSDSALVYFVSKTKRHEGESRDDLFNGKANLRIYCSYKYETVDITLQSGKEIKLKKIVGLMFSTHDWLDNTKAFASNGKTIDELIQTSKGVQQKIVKICQ